MDPHGGAEFDAAEAADSSLREVAAQPRGMHVAPVDSPGGRREAQREDTFGAAVLETAACLVGVLDRHGRIEMFNRACEDVTGFTLAEVKGKPFWDIFVQQDERDSIKTAFDALEARHFPNTYEHYWIAKDGRRRLIALSNTALLDDADRLAHIVATGIDITERHETEQTLRASEHRLVLQYETTALLMAAATLEQAAPRLLEIICTRLGWDHGAMWCDDKGDQALHSRYTWHLPDLDDAPFVALGEGIVFGPGVGMLGRVWSAGEPAWIDDIAAHSGFGRTDRAAARNVRAGLWAPITRRSGVFGVLEFFSQEARPPDAALLRALETIGAQVGHFIDRVQAEEALTHQALHDQLTGLPNRAYLADRLRQALRAAESAGTTVALLLLDLNRFKEVNDTLGHHYGDMVLREVSARVQSVIRGSATLARLGGDEFAVVLPSADFTTAIKIARTILALLDMPYLLEEHSIDVGASLGISLYPDHGGEPSELLRRADVAMYIAKDTGGGYEIYSTAKDRHSIRRLTLAADLRLALANDNLLLYFQPLLALPEGKLTGVEVLVRWQHPERGLIMPEQFIPLAETTGLIGVLTLWVLEAALRQCAAWYDAGCRFGVSVNISVRTLQDAQLPDTVAWLLHRYDVAPDMLTLEITESTLMADPLRAMNVLTRLAKLGVRIAIDDFGTGYSSLAYLKGLPIHEIKIDKSFVIGMGSGENDTAIVRSVIELGHNLGMQVVAEGVEHQPAWNVLVGMGCDIAQGNYMSVPVPALELEAWLARTGHFPSVVAS